MDLSIGPADSVKFEAESVKLQLKVNKSRRKVGKVAVVQLHGNDGTSTS